MIWVNLNPLKTAEWRKYVDAHRRASEPFQAYLIHSQKSYSGTASERWWSLQSNVHGVVIAANVVTEDSIRAYPKSLGPIIEHFIPDVAIAETDFEEAEYKDVVSYSGDNKRTFFAAVQMGLWCLRDVFHGAKSKQEASYVEFSSDCIAAALEHCDEDATGTAEQDLDSRISRTLRTPQAIHKMKRHKRQSSLVRFLDFGNRTSIFGLESMVNSVVWLIRRDTFLGLMDSGATATFGNGETRLVTSQSNDKRRVQVKPPLKAVAELDASDTFICVLLAKSPWDAPVYACECVAIS